MQTTSNAVFLKKGKVLFEKRRDDEDNYAGIYALPGGHLRKNETARRALAREMKEELHINAIKAEFIGKFKDRDFTSGDLFLHNYFLCTDYEGKIKKTYEQKKLRWMSAKEIEQFSKKRKLIKTDLDALRKIKVIK